MSKEELLLLLNAGKLEVTDRMTVEVDKARCSSLKDFELEHMALEEIDNGEFKLYIEVYPRVRRVIKFKVREE